MSETPYPRSPKVLVGGLAHLGRFIDKIRLRHAGHIQDYNYFTTGFDKYLVELLQIDPKELETKVLSSDTEEEILTWISARGASLSEENKAQWNQRIFTGGPKDDAARQRFQNRLVEIAAKRSVPVEELPNVSTWADVIELDEGRM